MVAPAPPYDELVHLGLSPWSLHARWALAVLRHPVTFTPYAPGPPGEWILRARLRFPSGPISVPVLFRRPAAGGVPSQVTAAAAVDGGADAPPPPMLFPPVPPGEADEVAAWAATAQEVLSYSRAAVMSVAASTPEGVAVMSSLLPAPMRSVLPAAVVRWIGARAANGLVTKYPPLVDRTTARAHMDRLAAVVSTGGSSGRRAAANGCVYLVGGAFSYADIAMVIATGVVRPLDERYISDAPLRSVKALVTDSPFAEGLDAVITWRDAILAAHFADDSLAGEKKEGSSK
ncbi:hypothetical protein MMPV_000274 [Pyropia vietnamensis]